MLHGNGGNYTEWTDSYLPEQADRMIAAGEIPPMIIVMPDDGEATYWANWSEGGPRWGDYVTEDVVSTIDQRYRTLPDAASRAIGGLSMGGLGALSLAFQHPDVFGVVGGHSPSVRVAPDPALWFLAGQTFWDHNPVWLAHNATGLSSLKIWLDAGTEDVWLPNIEAVHNALVEEGLSFEWHVFPGPHEAEYWIEHIPDYLNFYGRALRT
jgi:enterochelin esterase-like enzyme